MTTPDHLEARLQQLESRLRLQAAGLVLLGVLLLYGVVRPASPVGLIQARRIQLIDGTGQVWMDLHHDSSETALFILDADHATRVGVAQFAHGGGGVALHGPGGRGAAVLYLKGEGSVSFFDSTGTRTARFPAVSPGAP